MKNNFEVELLNDSKQHLVAVRKTSNEVIYFKIPKVRI
jgi:hypothetical protein